MTTKNVISLGINNASEKYIFRPYGVCATDEGDCNKIVSFAENYPMTTFTLAPGATILVKFKSGNVGSFEDGKILTLNVHDTGGRPIKHRDAKVNTNDKIQYNKYNYYWEAGDVIEFRFDGDSWEILDKAYFAGEGLQLGDKATFDSSLIFNLKPAKETELGGFKTGYVKNGNNIPVKLDEDGNAYVSTIESKDTTYSNGWGLKLNNEVFSVDDTVIPSLDYVNTTFATKTDLSLLNSKVALKTDLSEYATEVYVDNAIANLEIPDSPNLDDYVSKTSAAEEMNGSLTAAAFYEASDERLKDFENDVNIDFEKLIDLKKKYFTWKKDSNKKELGVSAQEIKELYPEIVSENSDGILSVDYSKLSVISLAAIDKLYIELKQLNSRINDIENKLNNDNA